MELELRILHTRLENEQFQTWLFTESLKKDQLWKMDHILTWSIYTRLNKGPFTQSKEDKFTYPQKPWVPLCAHRTISLHTAERFLFLAPPLARQHLGLWRPLLCKKCKDLLKHILLQWTLISRYVTQWERMKSFKSDCIHKVWKRTNCGKWTTF